MSGIFSALTRAIWTFIVLSGAAVFIVAATDDPRAWPLLSVPGFAGIAVVSLVIGWLVRRRPAKDAEASEPRARNGRRPSERREPDLAGGTPRAERDEPAPDRTVVLRSRGSDTSGEALPEPALVDEAELEPSASEGPSIRRPAPTGDSNVDRCFDVAGLHERPDHRRWQDIPRLVEARGLRRSGDTDAALARLAEIRGQFPDYDQLWLWTAEVLDRAGRKQERDGVLIEGLGAAKAKAAILATLGAYAAQDRKMDEAVEWLVRSATLQLGGGGETASWAFLDLAALSEPHRQLSKARNWLLEQADRIDTRGTRLADDFLEERRALSREKAEPWMLEAIETLWRFYGPVADAPKELPEPRQTPRNSLLRAERRRRPQGLR